MIDDKKIEELISAVLSKGYDVDFRISTHIPKTTDLNTALFDYINYEYHLQGDFRKDPWPFSAYTTIDGSKFSITKAKVKFNFEPNNESGLDLKSILISAYDLEMEKNQIYKTIEINSNDEIPTPLKLLTMAREYLSSKKKQLPTESQIDSFVKSMNEIGYDQRYFSYGYLFKDERLDLKTCILNHMLKCANGERQTLEFPHKVSYVIYSPLNLCKFEFACILKFDFDQTRGIHVTQLEYVGNTGTLGSDYILKINPLDRIPSPNEFKNEAKIEIAKALKSADTRTLRRRRGPSI